MARTLQPPDLSHGPATDQGRNLPLATLTGLRARATADFGST